MVPATRVYVLERTRLWEGFYNRRVSRLGGMSARAAKGLNMTISKTSVRSVLGHRHGAASVAFSFVGLVLSAGGCSCDEGPPPLGS